MAEALEHDRSAQQAGDLQEAPDLRCEDVPATGQGRAVDRAPELPVQPGDLPHRAPRAVGCNTRHLDRHLHVAQILEHEDAAMRRLVEVAVQERGDRMAHAVPVGGSTGTRARASTSTWRTGTRRGPQGAA